MRSLEYLLGAVGVRQSLDEDNVRLVDVQHEVLLLIREEALYKLHRGNVGIFRLAHQQYNTRLIGNEVQLLCADINVARQDIIRDDVLYESSLVVLLLIIVLRLVEGHRRNRAYGAAQRVAALGERRVIELRAGRREGAVSSCSGRNWMLRPVELVEMKVVQS